MQEVKRKLNRQLQRLYKEKERLDALHNGNEDKFTYHGGWTLGYVTGKITALENALDEIVDLEESVIRSTHSLMVEPNNI